MIVLLHGFSPPGETKSLYTPENSVVGLEDEPFFFWVRRPNFKG